MLMDHSHVLGAVHFISFAEFIVFAKHKFSAKKLAKVQPGNESHGEVPSYLRQAVKAFG